MRKHIFIAILLSGALAACSGSGDGNVSNDAAGNEAESAATASYDSNSAEGQAYRAVLECAATMRTASILVSADDERRRNHARALKARAIELGTALGLSSEAVEEQFTAHEGTFVQTQASGSMEQFGASVAGQAEECAANYPDITP